MNAMLSVLVLLLTALPIIAQTKTLVATEQIPIAGADNYSGAIAMPTTCDEQGRIYVKLIEDRGMEGPLFRLSSHGIVEAKFDTSGTLMNLYAARPDGGVIMVEHDGSTDYIDNFAPDGRLESVVALEAPTVPFFPGALAMFRSGEILVSGARLHPVDKTLVVIYDPSGRLAKQLVLDSNVEIEDAVDKDTGAQRRSRSKDGYSVAIPGDDGLVYLMRLTSPATVYAISSSGDVVRQIVVRPPSINASVDFGIRVAKNRLVVEFRENCGDSCARSVYTVVDATTSKQLATYEAVGGPMACFVPNPDRFQSFFWAKRNVIVEAEAK